MPEVPVRLPLAERVTNYKADFIKRLAGQTPNEQHPKLRKTVVERWTGYPTKARHSAAHGISIAYAPETPAELVDSIRVFSAEMRKKVGEGEVDLDLVKTFEAVTPATFKTPVGNKPDRAQETNYARLLLERIDLVSTMVTETQTAPTTKLLPADKTIEAQRLSAAILAGKIHHLAVGLEGASSTFNTQARLQLIDGITTDVMTEVEITDFDPPLSERRTFRPVPEPAQLVDPDTIRARRELARSAWDDQSSQLIWRPAVPTPEPQEPLEDIRDRRRLAEYAYKKIA